MENRVRLRLVGLSYSQLQSGAYALVLAEENGPLHIPVVIGAAEAQSIAIALEQMKVPRPMTHELFVSFAHAFGVKIKEVFIYNFEEGIFSAEITFYDGDRTVVLDARTSDAIALAIRTHSPIYTTREILNETGFIIENDLLKEEVEEAPAMPDEIDMEVEDEEIEEPHDSYHADPRPENFTIEELERTLADLIDKEDYEEAARISEILDRKKGLTDNSNNEFNI